MMNAYSFITTPDVPLLFFGTVFLFYTKDLKNKILECSFIRNFCCIAFYSKYQVVLLVFLVISNLKMLTKPYIYLAGFY